ncbi:sorbosone dehydrogenase family protein, partial [Pseudomonas sp. NBRC 111127]
FHYQSGATHITDKGQVVTALPGGPLNHHWTKNVIASPNGKHLYVTVGSNSNVAENGMDKEQGRAAIWEVNPANGQHRLFATGLRNPNGLAWEPNSGSLWTAVNERDEIGSDLVPDYITSVKDGGFYGWPYSYYGQHVDSRVQPPAPQKVAQALVPDYAVGPHTASLGLAFAEPGALPAPFQRGAFVGQHGSWNRKPHSGYKVIFVPFDRAGKPAGSPVDLLSGFLDEQGQAKGRPVGVINDGRGAVLVADDVGNVVWRVSKAAATAP